MAFLGQHLHAIDAQRRIAIPREWRIDDGKKNQIFFLFPGRNHTVQALPEALFESEILMKVQKVSIADETKMRALARIGSIASRTVCDKQGRITLTESLMQHAGLERDAMLVGALTCIQIMTVANWNASEIDTERTLDQIQKIQSEGVI